MFMDVVLSGQEILEEITICVISMFYKLIQGVLKVIEDS